MKPLTRLKKILGLPSIEKVAASLGIAWGTAKSVQDGKAGEGLENMTKWLARALEMMPEPDRRRFIRDLKPRDTDARSGICLLLMEAISVMPKWMAVEFLNEITGGER